MNRRLAISEACAEIDAQLGNRRGTAERGLWFWLWPPGPTLSPEVLAALHRDALAARNSILAKTSA